jgi:hypothetical protein
MHILGQMGEKHEIFDSHNVQFLYKISEDDKNAPIMKIWIFASIKHKT